MKLAWVVVLLLACSEKKQEPKVVPPEPVPPPTTPLERAQRQLGPETKPSPSALVALAYAQVVAKQPALANKTLASALAAARADQNTSGSVALVEAVEVMLALGDRAGAATLLDEAMARLGRSLEADELPAMLLAPDRIQAPLVIDRLAEPAARALKKLDVIEISSPAWYAILASARKQPGDVRAPTLARLASVARRAGKTVVALDLAREAATIALETPSPWALDIARELAFGPSSATKKIITPVPARLAKRDPADRAIDLAKLAEIHAHLGDKSASKAFEAKALAEKQDEAAMWSALAIARAYRDDIDGAVAMTRAHPESAGAVAYALVEANRPVPAQRVIDEMSGQNRAEETARIVELEVRLGRVDAARARALHAPKFQDETPGLDHVLRSYARAGNVPAIRELAAQDTDPQKRITEDVFIRLAARVLASQRRCDDAIAAAKQIALNSAEVFAVIARYCPNTKL
jgi:hypothetical protein